jgi:hypothetical protein
MDPMQNPEERDETRFGPQGTPHEEAGFEGALKKTQEGMRSMKEQASQSLEQARRRLKEGARNTLFEQKDKSVAGLQRISSAIHEAATRLNQEGDHTLAEYTEMLGAQVEKAKDYLRDRDPSTVLRDLEGFARRQAGLFIGAMFVTGLIVGRLIKTSRRPETTGTTSLAPEDVQGVDVSGSPKAPAPSTTQVPPSSRFGAQDLGPLEP